MEKRVGMKLHTGAFNNDGNRAISGVVMPYDIPTMRAPFMNGKPSTKVGFKIKAGAFGDFENDESIRLLYNHDSSQILGVNRDNLNLEDTPTGIKMRATLMDKDPLSDSVYNRIERRWIQQMSPGMSFSAKAGPSDVEQVGDDQYIFVFDEKSEVRLEEVSIVGIGAFDGTKVGVGGGTDVGFSDQDTLDIVSTMIDEYKKGKKEIVPVGVNLRGFV